MNLAVACVLLVMSFSAAKKIEAAELVDNSQRLHDKTSKWIGEELSPGRHELMNKFYTVEAETASGLRLAMIKSMKTIGAGYFLFIVLNGSTLFFIRTNKEK